MLDFSLPNIHTELSGCQMGKEKDAFRKSQIIILVDDNSHFKSLTVICQCIRIKPLHQFVTK